MPFRDENDGKVVRARASVAGAHAMARVVLYRRYTGIAQPVLEFPTIRYSCEYTSNLQFLCGTEIPIYAQSLRHNTK